MDWLLGGYPNWLFLRFTTLALAGIKKTQQESEDLLMRLAQEKGVVTENLQKEMVPAHHPMHREINAKIQWIALVGPHAGS